MMDVKAVRESLEFGENSQLFLLFNSRQRCFRPDFLMNLSQSFFVDKVEDGPFHVSQIYLKQGEFNEASAD